MLRIAVGLLAVLVGAGCSGGTRPTDAASRLRGRTVRILVGFGPGGGYDLHARVLASHLGRHLPGQPAVVVQNMPGAGGLVATNHLARRVGPDDLTIGIMGPYAVLAQFLGQPGVQFDVRDFGAIGSPTSDDADVCVVSRASGIDLATWRRGGVSPRLGFTATGSANHVRALLLTASLGLALQPVVGYQSNGEIRLAIESGEVDGTCLGVLSYLAVFGGGGGEVLLLKSNASVLSLLDAVPDASALVSDDAGRGLLDTLEQLRALDRYYVTPPATPDVLVSAFRRAFDETMADDRFLRDATAARLAIRSMPFDAVESRVASVLGLPAAARHRIAALVAGRAAP